MARTVTSPVDRVAPIERKQRMRNAHLADHAFSWAGRQAYFFRPPLM